VGAQISSSSYNTIYALSYSDPYFTKDGISLGYDIYHRKIDAQAVSLGQYITRTTGISAKLGVPVTEIDTIQYGIGFEETSISTFPTSPLFYTDYVNVFGERNTALMPSIGWVRDGRDSLIYPTSGTLQRAFADGGLPGGTLRYYRTNYQYQRYFPLTRETTVMWNGEIGYGGGYGGKPLPFFKNYFAGGVSSIRGYRLNTVGPRDAYGDPRGGDRKLLSNLEYLFPFPGLNNDRSVRLSAFFDAGEVADNKYDANSLRYSTGMALAWVSPFGPLKFSLAVPLVNKTGDHRQIFQFTFGGAF
jgi:outer membrane protein insertion porin family